MSKETTIVPKARLPISQVCPALSSALLLCSTVDAALQQAFAVLHNSLGISVFKICILNAAGTFLVPVATVTDDGVDLSQAGPKIPTGLITQEGYTLICGKPSLVDWGVENRFRKHYHNETTNSSVCAVLRRCGAELPVGVMVCLSNQHLRCTVDELEVLHTVANIMSFFYSLKGYPTLTDEGVAAAQSGMIKPISLQKRSSSKDAHTYFAVLSEFSSAIVNMQFGSLYDALQAAAECTCKVLAMPFCKVLELEPSGTAVRLKAGIGFQPQYMSGLVPTGLDSQAGYTLLSCAPVVVTNLDTEARFNGPALLHEHHVKSGISCVIRRAGYEVPYGVLGTHDIVRRKFTADMVSFVQSMANCIATAVDIYTTQAVQKLDLPLQTAESEVGLLTVAMQQAARLVPTTHITLMLYSGSNGDVIDLVMDRNEHGACTATGGRRMQFSVPGLDVPRSDVEVEPNYVMQLDTRTITLPLCFGSETLGLLQLQSGIDYAFHGRVQDQLQELCTKIAIALTQLHIREQTQLSSHLAYVTQLLLGTVAVDDAVRDLHTALDATKKVLNVDLFCLHFVDSAGTIVSSFPETCGDLDWTAVYGPELSTQQTVAGKVVQHKRPAYIGGFNAAPFTQRDYHALHTHGGVQSMKVVPLMLQGHVLGFVLVASTRPGAIDSRHRAILPSLCNIFASAFIQWQTQNNTLDSLASDHSLEVDTAAAVKEWAAKVPMGGDVDDWSAHSSNLSDRHEESHVGSPSKISMDERRGPTAYEQACVLAALAPPPVAGGWESQDGLCAMEALIAQLDDMTASYNIAAKVTLPRGNITASGWFCYVVAVFPNHEVALHNMVALGKQMVKLPANLPACNGLAASLQVGVACGAVVVVPRRKEQALVIRGAAVDAAMQLAQSVAAREVAVCNTTLAALDNSPQKQHA